MSCPILGFEVEWYDQISGLVHNLFLKFFTEDNTIELLKEKAAFLKRIYYPELRLQDLFIGSTITIHHRLYTITSIANKATREYLKAHEVRYLCVLSGGSLRRGLLNVCEATKKYKLSLQHFFTTSTSVSLSLSSGVLSVEPGDTIVEIVGLCDQSSSAFHPSLLQNTPGATILAISASEMQDAVKQLSGVTVDFPATLCLVKPHVLKAYRTGELLQAINEGGFDIAALFSVHLTIPMAEEFFESYRGIVSDYSAMIDSVCAAPVLALAVTIRGCDDEYEVAQRFRDFCGPSNPALAKVLRPESLRARFGENLLHNAVHCTDLPDDGNMECRYFFETIANL